MKDNLRNTYNKIAEDWHKDHLLDDWWVEVTEKYLSLLPRGGSVLDVGCGSGVKSSFLASRGLQVTGVDLSDKMIEIARRENPSIKFDVLDLYDTDTITEKFDGVFAQAVLLHIPKKDTAEIIQKLKDRLKDDGYLYIGVKEIKKGSPEEDVVEEKDYGYDYSRFFSYYSVKEIEDYIKDARLKTVYSTRTQTNDTTWIQIIAQS